MTHPEPHGRSISLACVALVLGLVPRAAAQIVVEGEAPRDDDVAFSFVPFEVPAGTVEIEVRHATLDAENILDWGLLDPDGGFRGWGGGNTEPAIVGVEAASRSYRAGPIAAGTWRVVIGEAKIVETPARYRVEIELRTAPTLAVDPDRSAYAPVPALAVGARWYAGDFHVHSRESGDAQPTLDAIARFARERGLDFVLLSDHNTDSHVELIVRAQARHPALLFIPGVEYTTYAGHANGIGVTRYVDHLLGVDGATIHDAVAAIHAQGGLFSINHPRLDLGDRCIGCAWGHDVPAERVDAIEIATGGWSQSASLFTPRVLTLWNELEATGAHVAALGGSDDHRAGTGTGSFDSPIGDPLTMVYAEALSVDAIVRGVRAGRTVVRLQGPADPMLELSAGGAMIGDVVEGPRLTLRARATGGAGSSLRFVRNGTVVEVVAIDADPFEAELAIEAPYGDAEDRWRAEIADGRTLRTITSHLYVRPQPGEPPDAGPPPAPAEPGCSCRAHEGGSTRAWHAAVLLAFVVAPWRRAQGA
ncbi:MAG: PHP domain-containing protein [Sandaracinaceae bacterium]|nr:PHP domain-containing protein [Sandaracinaceae bacterium]